MKTIRRSAADIGRISILLSLLGMLSGFVTACHSEPVSAKEQPVPAVARPSAADEVPSALASNLVKVERCDVYEVIPAVGTLVALQTTRIGSQVTGRVDEVLADVGDVVTKGQPLVKLDTAFFLIEIDLRRAEIAAAKTHIDQAKQKSDRIERLWNNGQNPAAAEQTRDDASFALNLAQAQTEQATQALRNAEQHLKEATILAPYDGIVTQRLVDPGELLTNMSSTHVMEIQQIDTLELHFALAQENFVSVKPGTRIQYQPDGAPGLAGVGVVERIFPSLDEATRTFRCRVLIDNKDMQLRPSMLMRVGVVVREAQGVLALPGGAVFPTPRGQAVRVPKDTGYEERAIKTGLVGSNRIEILEGLSEGESVVMVQASNTSRPNAAS